MNRSTAEAFRFHQLIEPRQVIVADGRGRRITLKKPSARALCRLLEVLGDSARNQLYFAIVAPLMFIHDVDGIPVPLPETKNDLEILLDSLGQEGLRAVMQGLQQHFSHPAILAPQNEPLRPGRKSGPGSAS
jgi:hypothetical protein